MVTTNQPMSFKSAVSVALPHLLAVPSARAAPAPQVVPTVMEYPAGQVIDCPAGSTGGLFLLRRGQVRLLRGAKGTRRALVALLTEGEVFGDSFRAGPGTPGEYGIAVIATELQWFEGSASSEAFATALVAGFRAQRRCVRAFATKSLEARMAETLLTLGTTHGVPCTHGGHSDLQRITQQDLGDLVRASRASASTLINDLKRKGVLGSAGRVLCLRDLNALRAVAGAEEVA